MLPRLCFVLLSALALAQTQTHAQSILIPGLVRPGTQPGRGVTAQPIGEYSRPSGAAVSGFPDSDAPNSRSPCPVLNTLANHGVINRNGRDITRQMLRTAMMGTLNVDAQFADNLVNALPSVIDLADLSQHNFIEHDVSLVRSDASFGEDPASINPQFARDFVSRARNGRIGIQEIAGTIRSRFQTCTRKPARCEFGSRQQGITFGEAATVLQVLGAERSGSIRADWAESFIVNERFPSDWRRSPTVVPSSELGQVSRAIARAAGF